jgi:ribosome modulation factor
VVRRRRQRRGGEVRGSQLREPSDAESTALEDAGERAALAGLSWETCPERSPFRRSAWLIGHEVALKRLAKEAVQRRIDALSGEECRVVAKALAARSLRSPQDVLTMIERLAPAESSVSGQTKGSEG